MIFTSYFAQLKNLPVNTIPVAICGKSPDWYTGFEYKKLAPKWSFFKEWKINHDNDYYIEHYQKEVLDKLNPDEVVTDLLRFLEISNQLQSHIVLLCYEKPNDFCHRHLVAHWLNDHGFKCEELDISLINEKQGVEFMFMTNGFGEYMESYSQMMKYMRASSPPDKYGEFLLKKRKGKSRLHKTKKQKQEGECF